MAVLKCKMCGGDLEIIKELSVCECQHCGVRQTVPSVEDDDKVKLYNRANTLRLKCEFDKAAGVYETLVSRFPEEAEAYWGLVLCKYGIEYVEDSNGNRIPTCHRTLPVPVIEDSDFDMACTNADIDAKILYREDAKVFDSIQKKILKIAAEESPYDVFICYKERDDKTGERTEDSNIAQEIYTDLTQQGYRVFYARITLRELAGSEYEPYIYAALSSAKVMIAIGSKYEYYDAIWVKNEWSRFISMMREDNSKILIPCYKGIDAYDIPKELRNMQGLNIEELTFLDNLKANIKRVISKGTQQEKIIKEAAATNKRESIGNFLKRISMFLEDGNTTSANDYCEKILDMDPENGDAYFYKFMIEAGISDASRICYSEMPLKYYPSFEKAVRFGNEERVAYLEKCEEQVMRAYCEKTYAALVAQTDHAKTEQDWYDIINAFGTLEGYSNSQDLMYRGLAKINSLEKQAEIKQAIKEKEEEINDSKLMGVYNPSKIFPFIFEHGFIKVIFIILLIIWLIIFGVFQSLSTSYFELMGSFLYELFTGEILMIPVLLAFNFIPGIIIAGFVESFVRKIQNKKANNDIKNEFDQEMRKKNLEKTALEDQLRDEEKNYNDITFK